MDEPHHGCRVGRLRLRIEGRALTAAAVLAVALAGCAGFLGTGTADGARRLRAMRRVGGVDGLVSAPSPSALRAPAARLGSSGWFARASAGLVVVLAFTGRGGLAVPLAVAAAAVVVPSRRRAAETARRDARVAADLPRVIDLIVTCLEAGVAPADAVVLGCEAAGGPVRDALLLVASAIRVGVDPAAAWAGLAATGSGDALRRVARAFARAASTGAPLADTLSAVADDERERLRWTAEAAARRAGVRAVGPIAVCFLPAFLLLGVVPVVVGVAAEVFGQLG